MIHLSRSTAVFAVCLLLSVAVVYRFFHAENKSIFAQRYCPCTPPDGTKHTNVRRAGTKRETIVKDMHYPLVSCGFSTLAALAEMRYTGNAKTNVKERNSLSQTLRVCQLPRGGSLWRVRALCALAGNFAAMSKAPSKRTTSPAPGEDVTAGDKRGNLSRRSRDWGSS